VRLLEKKIDDYKFINIIRKMLKAGYMENWTFNKTYSGTPQGGVISPLLANVYLHELDCFVMTLAETYTKGKARKHDLAYRARPSKSASDL
jgi:retron-type reverse transcriptase